jgi:hypothetical protein
LPDFFLRQPHPGLGFEPVHSFDDVVAVQHFDQLLDYFIAVPHADAFKYLPAIDFPPVTRRAFGASVHVDEYDVVSDLVDTRRIVQLLREIVFPLTIAGNLRGSAFIIYVKFEVADAGSAIALVARHYRS